MEDRRQISGIQSLVYIGLAVGIYIFLYLFLHKNLTYSLIFSLSPILIFVFIFFLKNPYAAFLLLFTVNYFIMGVSRYIDGLMGGVVIDAFVALVFMGITVTSATQRWPWVKLKNGLIIAVSAWFLFCVLSILNPLSPIEAWIIGVRRTALYFLVIPVLTFLLLNRYRDLKIVIIIWSVFVILAVLKALIQKYVGFDPAEAKWLYVEGKAATHIIYSGIRYFSFFTDAANFGCGMAYAMVFFSISAFFVGNRKLKFYFISISILAAYGMLISGTRVAIAIPFVGYALFTFMSKNKKLLIIGTISIIGAFIFLNFTNYGQGNSYIRRMRTAFHPTKDASFIVRMEHQKTMRAYLADKPFGVGIGTAKAAQYSDTEISEIPTDSWLVMIWVETGIVGLLLYTVIIGYIMLKGCRIILFEVKSKELRGIEVAFFSSTAGIFVASYANEVVAQFPNGPIIYMALAFIFMGPQYEQQIIQKNNL